MLYSLSFVGCKPFMDIGRGLAPVVYKRQGFFLDFAKHECRLHSRCLAKPLAVPKIICAVLPYLMLDYFDRCAFLALLNPPPAAQGSSTSVTAKNAPPERFLNAASNPCYVIETKDRDSSWILQGMSADFILGALQNRLRCPKKSSRRCRDCA